MKQSKKNLIIGSVILVVGGVIAFFVWKKFFKKDDETKNTLQPVDSAVTKFPNMRPLPAMDEIVITPQAAAAKPDISAVAQAMSGRSPKLIKEVTPGAIDLSKAATPVPIIRLR